MGFTAVTIVAPNVPDGVDPLTYFTAKPKDKAQELAQQQAQAPGFARLNGSVGSETASTQNEPQDARGSSKAMAAQNPPSLTAEQKQAAQDAKTCVIPKAATAPVVGQNLDYPYLFPQVKLRSTPVLLGSQVSSSSSRIRDRASSKYATKLAPILRPTEQEFMDQSPYDYLQNIVNEYKDFGMVRIVPPESYKREPIPFGQDISGLKCEKQVFMNPKDAETFDALGIRKGFFRAVLRFHATAPVDKYKRRLQKLPTFERKPVDLYRLFRSVRVRGGLDAVVKRKEWAQIGRELGYASQALPTLSSTLRQAYARALQPFEQFLEDNAVHLNPHVIPRLDVEDGDRPAKPRAGVRVLPNGIIVDAQGETVKQDREIVVVDESRNQGPSSTPKSFRQRGIVQPLAAPSLTADEKEDLYWALPAYFETERLSKHPGVTLLPFPDAVTRCTPYLHDLHSHRVPWKLSSLPFHPDALARNVHEDIDDLVVPHLHIGQQFATQTWSSAPMAAYTISSLVDGEPRTWYTTDGVFADQQPGDMIIIFPGVEIMNWCHGYSAIESVALFPGFNWLKMALDPVIMNKPMRFCVQRLVFEASQVALSPVVQTQVLEAIEIFRERERAIVAKLGQRLKRIQPDPSMGSRSITCVVTGAKRFWSWVLVNGEPWSAEAVMEADPAEANLVFVSRYTDLNDYFDVMAQKVLGEANNAQNWRKSVAELISGASLPQDSELRDLNATAPNGVDDNKVAAHLSSIVNLKQKWLSTLEDSEQHKRTFDGIRATYNTHVACTDETDSVENARQKTIAEMNNLETLWREFLAKLSRGEVSDSTAFHSLEQLAPRVPQIQLFIQKAQWSIEWARKVLLKVQEEPTDCSSLLLLKEQGAKLGISTISKPMIAIDQKLSWRPEKSPEIDRMMLDRTAFNSKIIRQYRNTVDVNSLQPHTRDRFLILVANISLIDRMSDPDLLKRPQRREAEVLNTFPAFAYAISDLNIWLSNAQSLDWLLILGQLQKLAAGSPEAYSGPRISVNQLLGVRRQMYELKIVPDDITLVQKTIEEATRALESAPLESRSVYGFDP